MLAYFSANEGLTKIIFCLIEVSRPFSQRSLT